MKMPTDAIREEIQKSVTISFVHFLELTLCCPETGYYEAKKDKVCRASKQERFLQAKHDIPLCTNEKAWRFDE
jgi:SAM-dependent MidA family methyltransferase